MTAAIAPKTGFKFTLAVVSGPERGCTYQLLPPRVTIGRDPESHVRLNDPRVSRHAAVLEFSLEKITISDVSSRNSLRVNSETVLEASIKNGDMIRIGDSELKFSVEALAIHPMMSARSSPDQRLPGSRSGAILPFAPGATVPAPGLFPGSSSPPPPPGSAAPRTRPVSQANASGTIRFYVILSFVLLLFTWLMTSQNAAKKPESRLRTVEQIENDIKSVSESREAYMKQNEFNSPEEELRHREAQRHYSEGFRDYQKGQFARAMKSFETARAINPNHELAARYYKLAEKQRDEMIAMFTLEGRRYREKHMFSRCSAALEKALDALQNPDDLKYKQVEELKKDCDARLKGRFR